MAGQFQKIFNLSVLCVFWVRVASAEPAGASTCDMVQDRTRCDSNQIEAQEEQESTVAKMELLQANKIKQDLHRSSDSATDGKMASKKADSESHAKQANTENKTGSDLVIKDHNGKMCMLCGKPLADRVDRDYPEFRTDCGGLSSATGPSASTLTKPVAQLTQISEAGVVTNGFCQLNFAKSCVDAVANKDYLYWAKSINLKAPGSIENAAFDGRYCRLNGFLQTDMVALQHDFHATHAKADELCKTKYAKYNIGNITFKDMMSAARYDDKSAPNLDEAELLAAWNCAMGDLGCDMALCAYSFCEKDSGTGLYDECEGWHPVRGMPSKM